nr:MAG TPA: hypothetical protein [Caudoviricetes sp.]
MENITIGQIVIAISILSTIGGVLLYLAKIYKKVLETSQKIDSTDVLTRANLKATKVMLDHFIEDKIGNGEFKHARQEIDEVLIERKVS